MGDNRPTSQYSVSALFSDSRSAQEAVRELLGLGVPAGDISMTTHDEHHETGAETGGIGGIAREVVGDEGIPYRASSELPNYEDLPTTEAYMTGRDLPVVTDFEVPPDEPLGGSVQLGLDRDAGLVRRMDAQSIADADIYTDFPEEPGGINPTSPVAGFASEPVAGDIGEGETLVSVRAGDLSREQVARVLATHGGQRMS